MKPTPQLLRAVGAAVQRQKSISFIGLGRMGAEMAYNLFSQTHVQTHGTTRFVVCDAREPTSTAFAHNFTTQFPGAQIEVANTPAEAILSSSTVVTMLPSSPHVRNVYAEEDGIIPALQSLSKEAIFSTLCIDSTTLDVEVARGVAADVEATGASMVDAPVSGGVAGAKAGTLSFLVGGRKNAFNLAYPYLTHMGQRVIYCGDSGAGLVAKICNNLILGVQQIAVAEGMLLGQKLGLDPKVLASVINSSTGACWSSSVNNPVPGALTDKSPPCERDYEGGFATRLMLKDMGLATDLADANGSPLPMGQLAEKVYADVVSEYPELENKDFSSVYRYLRSAYPKQ
ncbi:3-hydroxyisobutyrate dehydrogenase [Lentinus tigrinus ALCF2SS1-7]|uniref:3-hydroxyisobutyrate dehydrogenase n=1 Tax=Lentinus tigrinus ALCF2SS1-6 TaxID=1328759 RepID=A0A5C2SQ99_9APHY|nr:3-hydroxyisobutyrate dehydrogenase [Lentinus tigrinus ALCF2SS1-6]RPD79918.1 3-hydroxyisobutyrate dehydrogenase [Lentinus tigrinus ALCF2SS1-7]